MTVTGFRGGSSAIPVDSNTIPTDAVAMSNFVLPLFPHDSVAVSVTTTVWVGVCVVVFFNLRLGWTLSGLVVPGYLVPLLIVKPLAALVIVGESFTTYGVVHVLSRECFPRWGWCGFFGRDRFLALIVASVAVRAAVDGWLLPWAGAVLNNRWGFNLDYHNDLHSYGLVMVALMANYFWKPGLLRGSIPLAVTVGATYTIIRFGLVHWTNFNLGNLHSMYEGIATSLLASPKAYMIVIVGAYVASAMNLGFGWEFNGILVPALLALHWHEPWKIFITLGEAGVILLMSSLLLKLPVWQRTTVEGARKILIFFTICFVYRLALNHIVPRWFPYYRVTDFYGFGYLLSTLLAIKAYQHERKIQLVRNTLQASMMGAVGGTCVGFLFTCFHGPVVDMDLASVPPVARADIDSSQPLSQCLQEHKLSLYRRSQSSSVRLASNTELARFGQAIQRLRTSITRHDEESLAAAQAMLRAVNYQCTRVEGRYYYVHELPPGRGWGAFVLDANQPQGPVIEVPAPREEPGPIEAALSLFRLHGGSALAIAGSGRHSGRDGSADVLSHPATFFGTFHRQVDRGNIIQVRGYTRASLRRLTRARPSDADLANETWTSSLWIRNGIPAGLNLQLLKELIGQYDIHWQATPTANALRDSTRSSFAELVLNRADRRRLRGRDAVHHAARSADSGMRIETASPYAWLLGGSERMAARGSNGYVPCAVEEMIYFDEEILRPIVRVLSKTPSWREAGPESVAELELAADSATAVGYRVTVFAGDGSHADHLAIHEQEPRTRHWGTIVLRWTLPGPHVVEVPRPIFERNTYEFAIHLFRRPSGAALLIAGADPRANADGTADISRLGNKVNLVNLARHVLLRELGPRPQLVVQARAIRAPVNADVLLAVDQGLVSRQDLTSLKETLVSQLEQDGLTVQFTNGSPLTAGYEMSGLLLEAVTAPHENKELAVVWLSPSLRSQYAQQSENELAEDMFDAVGIPSIYQSLSEYVATDAPDIDRVVAPHSVREAILGFLRNHDVVQLRRLRLAASEWKHTRLVDATSGQAFLIVATSDGRIALIANLSSADPDPPLTVTVEEFDHRQIEYFIESRATFVERKAQP
jgi:hypothetical protein